MASGANYDDLDGGPISYDEIEPNLYLGNVTAATHMETLKQLRISHILTLDSVPLPSHIARAPFTLKYVHVSDMPKEDLLHYMEDCISFIDSAIQVGKNVLVHCYFGVSRSATIVIAYVMRKYQLTYSQAYGRVKSKRRIIGPNCGFVAQLKLFCKMGYKIDHNDPTYKCYRLKSAADKVRKAKILPQNCMDLVKPDPGLTQENPEPIVYRCRKCRRIVANKSNVISHMSKAINGALCEERENEIDLPTPEPQEIDNVESQPLHIRSHENAGEHVVVSSQSTQIEKPTNQEVGTCKHILFVEPIAWMKDILKQAQGRLNCPKCSQKLGYFSWINGCQCPCETFVAPVFYFIPSKVELSNVVQNVQITV